MCVCVCTRSLCSFISHFGMVRFGLWLFCVLDFIIGGSMAGPEVGRKLLRVSLGDGDIRFGDKVRGLVPTSAILETDTEEFGVLAGDELIHRIRESVSEEEYRRNVNIVVEDVDRLVANGPKQVKLDDVGDKAFYRVRCCQMDTAFLSLSQTK